MSVDTETRARVKAYRLRLAAQHARDFVVRTAPGEGRCQECVQADDVMVCPTCWGFLYLVHPAEPRRGRERGPHTYVCQDCDTRASLRERAVLRAADVVDDVPLPPEPSDLDGEE